MRYGRTLAFVMLALLAGGLLSQLPSAMADDSDNPFSALWSAIFDLQSRDEQLQAQIDELKAEREALLAQTGSEPVLVSDLYATMDTEVLEDGRTLVHITVGNNGPDRTAGVKLTAFYLMPLFEINNIDDDLCLDKSRGIIECIIGTLEEDQEQVITIEATARESGKANTWTVDVSTTIEDADYSNNHVTYDFETGSGEPIEIHEIEQPQEPEVVEQEPEITEPEQEQELPANSTETKEEPVNPGNQTSTEPKETSSGNPSSNETGSSNSTSTETQGSGDSESEGGDSSSNSAEQPERSADTGSSDSKEKQQQSESEPAPADEQSQEEQAASEGSGSGPAGEPNDDNSGESGQDESHESGEESSVDGENISDNSDGGQEEESSGSSESDESSSENRDGGETRSP